MMMASGGRLQTGIIAWFRDNAVVLAVIIGWIVSGLAFTLDLRNRVTTIEQRGSPEVSALMLRVASIETKMHETELQTARDNVIARIGMHEQRLAVVERNDQSEMEILKENAATMHELLQTLTKHMIDTAPGPGQLPRKP